LFLEMRESACVFGPLGRDRKKERETPGEEKREGKGESFRNFFFLSSFCQRKQRPFLQKHLYRDFFIFEFRNRKIRNRAREHLVVVEW